MRPRQRFVEQHAIYEVVGEQFEVYSHHVAMQVSPWNVVSIVTVALFVDPQSPILCKTSFKQCMDAGLIREKPDPQSESPDIHRLFLPSTWHLTTMLFHL